MSKEIHRLFDRNTSGQRIISIPLNPEKVYSSGFLVSVDTSIVESGSSGICRTANGSMNVFCLGHPVNRMDDRDTCGPLRARGDPKVFIGK